MSNKVKIGIVVLVVILAVIIYFVTKKPPPPPPPPPKYKLIGTGYVLNTQLLFDSEFSKDPVDKILQKTRYDKKTQLPLDNSLNSLVYKELVDKVYNIILQKYPTAKSFSVKNDGVYKVYSVMPVTITPLTAFNPPEQIYSMI